MVLPIIIGAASLIAGAVGIPEFVVVEPETFPVGYWA
jgi:hypothetical protein